MSSLEGPALLGVTSAPGRGWGDVPMVGPDAGAGRQDGPRGPRSSRGDGAAIWSVQSSDWPRQGEGSLLATAIARASEEQGAQLPSHGGHWLVPPLKS